MPRDALTPASAAVFRKVTWRLVPFLILIYFIAYVDRSNVAVAKLTLQSDLGLSDAAYGFGAGLFFIGYFFFEVPSNLALARFGARRWIARIMVTWGLIAMAFALTTNEVTFYILRFLLGAAEAGLFPGLLYFLTRWYSARRRTTVFGLLIFGNPLASIIGAPLMGAILLMDGVLGLTGWQWVFVVTGLPAVVLAVVVVKYLPDTPNDANWLDESERRVVLDELAGDSATDATPHGNPLRALKDKRILFMSALYIAFPIAGLGLGLWMPTIIADLGAGNTAAAVLSAIPYICAMVGLITIPALAERYNARYAAIAISCLVGALGFIGLVVLPSQPVLHLALLCVATAGLLSSQPIALGLPSRVLTGAFFAVGIACINSIANVGGFIGPYVVGALKGATGSIDASMLFLAAVMVYAAVMAVIAKRIYEPRPRPQAPVTTRPTVAN
ncbi:MFS transporter [Mycobacterium sp. NPDC003449]